MIIKKHPSGNQYIYAGDTWVRNFTKDKLAGVQLTNLYSTEDFGLVLKNQQMNLNYPKVSDENLNFKKIVIVSDGYGFKEKHKVIGQFPKDVCVLAVNRALRKWELFSPKTPPELRRTINGFVVNNPYKEAMEFLPSKDSKYFPTCVASVRTNYEFLRKYTGDKYVYHPPFEPKFGYEPNERYTVDDYRNPVCAAIGLAYRFGVEKLMLLCCDDSFEDERIGSIRLDNGLYTYPPLLRSHEIIDANLYWLRHQEGKEIKVVDCSNGPDYLNTEYINDEDAMVAFFKDQEEGTPNES